MFNRRVARAAVTVVLATLFAGIGAGSARAHGVSDTADVHLAATFAGNELTVIIRRAPRVPGPLQVDLVAHDPVRPVDFALRVSPLDGLADVASLDPVHIRLSRPGMHSGVLHAEYPGEWELEVRAAQDVARFPFRVLVPRPSSWELVFYGGCGAAGLLLIGALVVATAGRGNSSRVIATGLGGTAVIAITAAITAGLLSSAIPPAQPAGAAPTVVNNPADGSSAAGRPYVGMRVGVEPPLPKVGVEFALRLWLSDGSTGREVDDLVVHHSALAHVVITNQGNEFFRHIHPVRSAPGVLSARIMVDRPGRYLVRAELERADSGAQLVTGSFDVEPGSAEQGSVAPQAQAAPSGLRQETTVALDPAQPEAGRPATMDFTVTEDGRQVSDLQPWLGMAGHLIIVDESGGFFGHVHELGSMVAMSDAARSGATVPDETVLLPGSRLRFVFTFPEPGRYSAWLQYQRGFRVFTVPVTIEVRTP